MSITISRVLLASVLSVSLLLSACGFHLRGQIDVPESLMRMHVKGTDIELIRDVEKSLRFSNIEIVENVEGAAILDLSDTRYLKEVNGTNSSGIATSYKMTYTVNYVVFDAEQEILQRHSVNQSRTLGYNPSNVLVFEREEIYLLEEMRKELVSLILRRMGTIQ